MSSSSSKNTLKPMKLLFTVGALPHIIDAEHPPQTRKPFSSILGTKWCHSIDLLLPADVADTVQQHLNCHFPSVKYAKVFMSLADILEEKFFHYHKSGTVVMLSDRISAYGRDVGEYQGSLCEGVLRLEMDNTTYERCGLQGRRFQDGQSKHAKNRFAIEIDLRPPSMVRGKKQFDRLVWTAKNVLNSSMMWLFYDTDLRTVDASKAAPVERHNPTWYEIRPSRTLLEGVHIPDLSAASLCSADCRLSYDTFPAELEEWLSLVALSSSRVTSSGDVDPYICRYDMPSANGSCAGEKDIERCENIAILSWRGFLPAPSAMQVWLGILKTVPEKRWAAVQFHGLEQSVNTLTIMKLAWMSTEGSSNYFALWEAP